MKQLIESIRKSIYDPAYYKELLSRPMSFSMKYFFALVLFLAVTITIIISIPLVASANKAMHEFTSRFFVYLPDDFELAVTNGIATTNVPEPYFFPVPAEFKEDAEKGGMMHLAVVDTQTPFSLDQFNIYASSLWVGQDQVAYRDARGSVRIEPYTTDLNYVLNEQKIRDLESQIAPYYVFVGPIIVMLIFTVLSFVMMLNLLYLFFGALLIFALSKFMKFGFTYWKSYQIGLHALTVVLFIDIIFNILGPGLLGIPFLSTFIMLGIVYVNFQNYKPVMPSEAPAPTKEDTQDNSEIMK